jgi:hypothetical protein
MIFGLVVPKGKPKYVNGSVPFEQPKVLASNSILASVMLIGIIMDLL